MELGRYQGMVAGFTLEFTLSQGYTLDQPQRLDLGYTRVESRDYTEGLYQDCALGFTYQPAPGRCLKKSTDSMVIIINERNEKRFIDVGPKSQDSIRLGKNSLKSIHILLTFFT